MTSCGPTIADLKAAWSGTACEAALNYTLAQTHKERVEAVRMALDYACNELEMNRHKKQELDEDQLTIEICSFLNGLGFQAAHDQQIGGHCDIVIKGRELFLWLAEAKKHDAYDWLDKGFKQLSTRYSTGVLGQDNGEVIIYCFSKNANAMLKRWREELQIRNKDVKIHDDTDINPLLFCSTHKHTTSGLDFYVRHKVVSLYWQPADK
jgi:hypothetical protein